MKGHRDDSGDCCWRKAPLGFLLFIVPLAANGFQLDGPTDAQGGPEGEALGRARSWLKAHPCRQYGASAEVPPGDVHHRTLALALVDPGFFDRCSAEALLHVRELQHQLLVQLPTTAEKGQLALHVLALSASCQPIRDPRGRNLAQLLRKTSTDPVPRNRFSEATQLLALCSLGDRGRKLLDTAMTNIRELASESPAAVMDSIAMNVLAVACLSDNRIGGRSSAVYDALRPVAQLQKRDGSFGDIHTSGLVTQALVAVDPDGEQLGWSRHKALAHIGRAQHSEGHFGSLLATAQVAPLLAGRTLADLASHATRYCSGRANGSETIDLNMTLQAASDRMLYPYQECPATWQQVVSGWLTSWTSPQG
ncbi:cobalamin binding intrinsic factor isoform X2 [Haemaphysalis longicornis]